MRIVRLTSSTVTSWNDPAQSIMGLGLHLRRDVAGLRLRRLRHRRVRAGRIVGWRVSVHSLRTRLCPSMRLSRPCYDRRGDGAGDLVHHSDRGTQYLSMRYTERLAGPPASRCRYGSRGDAYDNASSPKQSSVCSRRR